MPSKPGAGIPYPLPGGAIRISSQGKGRWEGGGQEAKITTNYSENTSEYKGETTEYCQSLTPKITSQDTITQSKPFTPDLGSFTISGKVPPDIIITDNRRAISDITKSCGIRQECDIQEKTTLTPSTSILPTVNNSKPDIIPADNVIIDSVCATDTAADSGRRECPPPHRIYPRPDKERSVAWEIGGKDSAVLEAKPPQEEKGLHWIVYLPTKVLGQLMGIFTAKHFCCWCLKPPEEAKPFCQTAKTGQKNLNSHYNQVLTKVLDNDDLKRTPDSSEEANVTSSTHEDYTNETFESDAGTATITAPTATGAKKGSPSPPPRLQLGGAKDGRPAPRSPKSPLKSPIRRGSESESEDSLSVAHSETASDQSDLENRIRALSEDLKRRKLEAERLKKEAKKQQKERLRQEELALKKQIEAYDKYIAEARLEITDEVELQDRTVQPQIKKPTPGQKRSPPSVHRTPKEQRSRIDSDGSRSSSSIENGGESPGQTTPLSPITPGGAEEAVIGKGPQFVDSISESLMSPQISGISTKKTSTPEDRSTFESRSRVIDHSETIDEVPEEVSAVDGLEESTSEVKLRLDISKTEEPAETTKPATETQQPTTARSLKSITEDIPTESAAQSRPQSRAESQAETSLAQSKSEKVPTEKSVHTDKSIKSQYSSDYGDESDRSASQKSSRSFSYSTSKNSRSNTSYTDEFTDGTTGKSSPRRKDHTVSQSKKTREESQKSIAEDSIQTEEEVSEQLDAESDDEAGVMLEIDSMPPQASEPILDPLAHLSIGDRVLVGGAKPGVLRFKGLVKFADGHFGGVELTKPEGTNNGSKDGVEYFQCELKHGIFAPPEKLELLPANWKEEEPELSAGESDISEATIHEGEEDVEKIAELRKDVTKLEVETKSTVQRDGDESIAEDISVATTVDSELERVISSAAAAVESFGAEQLEEHSGKTSPVDTTVSDALSPREAPVDLEKVVDNITDGILHMVVKDSVESAGEVAQKVVSKRQSAELSQKDTVPNVEAKPLPTADDVPSTVSKTQVKEESNSDQAVEVATQKLLTESISQMLSIYKKKQKSVDETPQVEETEETTIKTYPSTGPMDPSQEAPEVRQPDILTLDDAGLDPFPGFSDGFGAGKDDLDQLYDEIGELTGTDEWFDDDFGLGIQKRAPPPYPGTQQDKIDKSENNELRLDLKRVTQEPFFAVPHRQDEVQGLVMRAVDYFWELRRFGESWADVTSPPDDYFRPDELRATDMESGNRRAYKQLVFDLTGEILTDIYQQEEAEEIETHSWMPPRRCRQKYYRGRNPPTMRDLVQPVVEEQVLRLSGLQSTTQPDIRLAKWSSRKKRDRVDKVLLQELVEEEPDWVDYNEDETTVKMQIADSIFDSLLVETASLFTTIAQRRAL